MEESEMKVKTQKNTFHRRNRWYETIGLAVKLNVKKSQVIVETLLLWVRTFLVAIQNIFMIKNQSRSQTFRFTSTVD